MGWEIKEIMDNPTVYQIIDSKSDEVLACVYHRPFAQNLCERYNLAEYSCTKAEQELAHMYRYADTIEELVIQLKRKLIPKEIEREETENDDT